VAGADAPATIVIFSREAAIRNGAARYRQASQQAVSARETELAAFGAITRALEEVDTPASRIRALGRNHDLWSMLMKDLAMEGNALPADLKTQLISLAAWAMRYSTLAILQDIPIQPLIVVNRNVAAGLAEQKTASPPTCSTSSRTITDL
jgi:flagellar protein FlaF